MEEGPMMEAYFRKLQKIHPEKCKELKFIYSEYQNFHPALFMDSIRKRGSLMHSVRKNVELSNDDWMTFFEQVTLLLSSEKLRLSYVFGSESYQQSLIGYELHDVEEIVKKNGLLFSREECTDPETITYHRLAFVFPREYLKPKPPSEGDIKDIMNKPEFGGLIPSSECVNLTQESRKKIVATHLYLLMENRRWPGHVLPLRIQQLLLKRRIETCPLNDEERMETLEDFRIIGYPKYLSFFELIAGKNCKKNYPVDESFQDFSSEILWHLFE